jgi:hypothetical protein
VAVADVVGVGGEDDDGAEDEEGSADDWAEAEDTPEVVLVAVAVRVRVEVVDGVSEEVAVILGDGVRVAESATRFICHVNIASRTVIIGIAEPDAKLVVEGAR